MLMPKKSNGCASCGQQRAPGHPSIHRNSPPQNHPQTQTLHNSNASVISCQLRRYYDWQIEVFFRFFKHVLGCRHLLSHCQNGIELEIYVAIIACLLIALWTGKKPNKATCEMVAWYLLGIATLEEFNAHLKSLKTQA